MQRLICFQDHVLIEFEKILLKKQLDCLNFCFDKLKYDRTSYFVASFAQKN